jgi:hypothetical protein
MGKKLVDLIWTRVRWLNKEEVLVAGATKTTRRFRGRPNPQRVLVAVMAAVAGIVVDTAEAEAAVIAADTEAVAGIVVDTAEAEAAIVAAMAAAAVVAMVAAAGIVVDTAEAEAAAVDRILEVVSMVDAAVVVVAVIIMKKEAGVVVAGVLTRAAITRLGAAGWVPLMKKGSRH